MGKYTLRAPIADDLVLRAARGAGIWNQARELRQFREVPCTLDAVDDDDGRKGTPSTTVYDDGRKGTTQAVKSSAVNLATFCDTTPPPACV